MPARAFWSAYDQLATAKTSQDSARVLFYGYENIDVPGHDQFMRDIGSTFDFLAAIAARRPYYDWWRKHAGAIDSIPAILARTTQSFQRLLPGAKVPVFLVSVGRVNASLLTFKTGYAAIAVDAFLPASDPPLHALTQPQIAGLRPFSDIQRAAVIALSELNVKAPFELKGEELLSTALNDGIPEMITVLLTGAPWASATIAYAERREAEIWREFQADRRAGVSTGKWFGAGAANRPGYLGRYVGYRIAQRYVEVSPNRTAAVKRLLEGGNPLDILRVSGYERDE